MTAPITQADREAAARNTVLVEMRELILAGRADHHAEPWAAHRIAAERASIERAADVAQFAWFEARDTEWDTGVEDAKKAISRMIRAIEQGGWRNDNHNT